MITIYALSPEARAAIQRPGRRVRVLLPDLPGLVLVAVLPVLAACAPQVVCPLGTYPKRVDTDSASTSTVGATGSLPSRSIELRGGGSGSSSVDYRCAPLKCPPGTALRISRTGPTETVECLPIPAPVVPAGAKP